MYFLGFAEMLVDAGIDSISLNPDSVLKVRQRLAVHESKNMPKVHRKVDKLGLDEMIDSVKESLAARKGTTAQ